MIKEIVPDIYTWSEFSQEKQLNFNGYFVRASGESVFIDPPGLSKEDLNELEERVAAPDGNELKAILLTNTHHDRASLELKERFKVPIIVHENDKDLLEFSPDRTFKDAENIFCGIQVINIRDQKSPGESGFLMEKRKILIVGDALIGKVPGKLNLLPADKYKDIGKAKEGLKVLNDYDFDILLVGDGTCILENAKRAVQKFLAQ